MEDVIPESKAKTILYSLACDAAGVLVHANIANRGDDYCCPGCGGTMVLRRSEKEGKGRKRAHYAHKSLTPNCNPETILHKLFKERLAGFLTDSLAAGKMLPFSWKCSHCDDVHEGELLKKAVRVAVEHSVGPARPDIALLDATGSVVVALEVVVTHPIDEGTRRFYDEQRFAVVEYTLTSDEVLEDVPAAALRPTRVSVCRNPRCRRCGKHQLRDKLMIIDATCWNRKCGKPMKVACMLARSPEGNYGHPDTFTATQQETARQQGVILKRVYSNTANTTYLANVCGYCGSFVGEHYLFTGYVSPALDGDLEYGTESSGYRCADCDWLDRADSTVR